MNGKTIRPLQGECLIYVDVPTTSDGGIEIPEQYRGSEGTQETITGQVRALGIWKLDKKGRLIPHPVKSGDRVVLLAGSGRWLKTSRERLKLVPVDRILAILEE